MGITPLATLLVLPLFAAPPAAASPAQDAEAPPVSQEELDQMLAPIALYPDELLSQIFMASTYPLELVEASRFVRANKELKGDALTAELEKKSWDASVKSLVNFPDVLNSLDDNLEWTRKIGDAFLADQKAVLDTVQKLRSKAKEAGNLESSEEMKVTTEPVPEEPTKETIIIEKTKTEVVYVPVYDPVVVYGTWWYPAYPPPVYYRPPYYRPGVAVTFGTAIVIGAAWGYAWGGCNWHHHHVNVNVNRNVNINANIDRSRHKNEINVGGGNGGRGDGAWQHDPKHRKGVEYRDRSTAKKFEGKSRNDAARAREDYRGRASKDRESLSRARTDGRIDSSGRTRDGSRGSTGRDTSRRSSTGRDASGRSSTGRDSTKRGSTSRDSSRSKPSTASKSRSRSSGGSGAFTGSRGHGSTSRASSRGSSSRGSASRGSASRGRSARGGRRG